MKSFNSDVPALFFIGPVEVGASIEIDPEEARHARALRLREGDSILLLDGAGRRSQGAVERVEKRRITVKVFNTVLEEPVSCEQQCHQMRIVPAGPTLILPRSTKHPFPANVYRRAYTAYQAKS